MVAFSWKLEILRRRLNDNEDHVSISLSLFGGCGPGLVNPFSVGLGEIIFRVHTIPGNENKVVLLRYEYPLSQVLIERSRMHSLFVRDGNSKTEALGQ